MHFSSTKHLCPIFFYCLLLTTLSVTSCADEEPSICVFFGEIEGVMDYNEEVLSLSGAERFVELDSLNNDVYNFRFSSVGAECRIETTFDLFVKVPMGESPDGIYDLVPLSGIDLQSASGTISTQEIQPYRKSSDELVGGILTLIDVGDNFYELDLVAITMDSVDITMSVEYQF